MRSGSGVVTSFLKFWEQPIKYMVRVVTNGLKQACGKVCTCAWVYCLSNMWQNVPSEAEFSAAEDLSCFYIKMHCKLALTQVFISVGFLEVLLVSWQMLKCVAKNLSSQRCDCPDFRRPHDPVRTWLRSVRSLPNQGALSF